MTLEFDPIAEAGRNWQRHEWTAIDAMQAATSLTRVTQISQSRIDAVLAPLDLNFSRFEVLALLTFSRTGALPMGKIGDRLQVHAASVTNTITRLEASGFVERIADPADGRGVIAGLLSAGRAAAEAGAQALGAIDFGLSGLGGSEQRSVTDALTSFRAANGDWTTAATTGV